MVSSICWNFGFIKLVKNGLTLGQAFQLVVLLYKAFCQTVVRTTLPDMISVQYNVNYLLPNVAFSKAILSHENCMSHSMSILWGEYTYPFFSTHLSKTYFAIASSIPWTGFIQIAWLSALNSCTRFSNLFAWCKVWSKATKVSENDQEIPQSHIAGQTMALRGRHR